MFDYIANVRRVDDNNQTTFTASALACSDTLPGVESMSVVTARRALYLP